MDFAVLYQTHPKLFLWWRVSVWSVLRCVCPKAVEFSLARGIVTFHGSTCFKRSVSKKERNWRRRGRSWRDPAQTSLVFHPFTVTELFYQLNAWNWPFMDRMRVRRAQPLPSPPIFSSFYRTQDFLTSCWHPFILVGEKQLKCLVHCPLPIFTIDCVLPLYSRAMCCLNSYGTTLLLVRISVTTLTSATSE